MAKITGWERITVRKKLKKYNMYEGKNSREERLQLKEFVQRRDKLEKALRVGYDERVKAKAEKNKLKKNKNQED